MSTPFHKKAWRHSRLGIHTFLVRLRHLFLQPVFIAITILGNTCVLLGAGSLYAAEHSVNPNMHSLLDAIWWAVATVTTVGYGDISPITPLGKFIGISMMIAGTALFWSYTALFAGALLNEELLDVETEIHHIEQRIRKLGRHKSFDHNVLSNLSKRIEEVSGELSRGQEKSRSR